MRTRNIQIILYDVKTLNMYLDIIDDNNLEYAYILHDMDIDKDNNIKKAHYHLLIFGNYQRTLSAWSTLFHTKQNMIEKVDNKRRSIRYLIHFDSKDKYHYNYNEIVTNMLDLDLYFNQDKLEESSQLEYIFNYLDSIEGYIYYKEVKCYVLANNYWSAYRRYYAIIKDVIIEHNRSCIDYSLR